ncbi:MAG: hypothetical protein AVDCRST_MAG18-1501 [uncultured Thermomicrobiales bacterium]|uniref:Uncharacterized protein n=1 Tax=uncultured Thermomicrobiales bacterium TaxID=1645740 RepID=A0A6J4V233_9BACT|nr:MAG: hypothetical protein AVDCRST_MAG18-1501 [uncultured Thermomicrobiales bacterium]
MANLNIHLNKLTERDNGGCRSTLARLPISVLAHYPSW